MAGLEINDFSSPEEVRAPDPTVNIDVVKLAGGEIGRYTFQPGWRWSQHIKPVVGGDSCQTEHVGYLVSGKMGIQTDDGTSGEVTPGCVYRIAPGHDGWVIGDEPVVVVEFQGAATYAEALSPPRPRGPRQLFSANLPARPPRARSPGPFDAVASNMMAPTPASPPVRLAEIVAALSLGIDLGFSQPMEHVLRQCLIALRVAERIGLDDEARAAVYYSALLVNVGCHSDAHEQAKWFGDDIAAKATKFDYEPRSAREAWGLVRLLGAGGSPLHRIRTGVEFAATGRHDVDQMLAQHAALARQLADRLELPGHVGAALACSYERWDGKGWPGEAAGDDAPVASRIVQLAEYVEVAYRTGGTIAARALAERRSGSQFDPTLVRVLCDHATEIFDGLSDVGTWQTVIDAEPALTVVLSGAGVDRALRAIAEFVDLKSPYMLGHSTGVAELAAGAGHHLNLGEDEVTTLHRAGLVHEFGRLGVSNSIWDKPGPLGAGEWERVRLHPYYAERMLQQSDALAPLARIVVQQRERLDGSGYPRGLPGSAISPLARILGAADAYQAMREERPQRPARSADEAAGELRTAVRAGHLDGDAVDAVLTVAGHRVPRRQEGPAGLTAREVEVLKLLALGLSNKQIAARLVISPKTAGNHIEHIYTKIGANSRAAAGLFAMQQGLLPEEGFPTGS